MEKCASTLWISQCQYVKDPIDTFKLLDTTARKAAKSFTYRFGPKDIHTVEWNILGDSRQITACQMKKNAKEQKKVRVAAGPAKRCVHEENKHCISNESSDSAFIYAYAYAYAYAWD